MQICLSILFSHKIECIWLVRVPGTWVPTGQFVWEYGSFPLHTSFLATLFPFIQSSMSCCTHMNCPEQTSCLFCFYHKCHSVNQPLGHAQVQWNLVFPSQTPSIASTPTSASVRPMKSFHKYSYCGWYKENFCWSKYIKTINIYRSRM